MSNPTTTTYGFDIGRGQFGPRGVLEVGEKSIAGNIVLRAGVERGESWEQVAHIVLTPREFRQILAQLNAMSTPTVEHDADGLAAQRGQRPHFDNDGYELS